MCPPRGGVAGNPQFSNGGGMNAATNGRNAVTPSSGARRRIILDMEEQQRPEDDAMVAVVAGSEQQHGEAKSVHSLSGRLSALEHDAAEAIRQADERNAQVATLKALEMQRGEQLARQEGRLKVRRDRQKREEKLQRMREKQAKLQRERAEKASKDGTIRVTALHTGPVSESPSKRQTRDKADMRTNAARRSPTRMRRSRLIDEIRKSGSGGDARHRSTRTKDEVRLTSSSSSKPERSQRWKEARVSDTVGVTRRQSPEKKSVLVSQPVTTTSSSLLGARELSDRSTHAANTPSSSVHAWARRVRLDDSRDAAHTYRLAENVDSRRTEVLRTSPGAGRGDHLGGDQEESVALDVRAMQENVRVLTAKLDKMKLKRKALELENEALKREMLLTLSPSSAAHTSVRQEQQQQDRETGTNADSIQTHVKDARNRAHNRVGKGHTSRRTDSRKAKENKPVLHQAPVLLKNNGTVHDVATELARERRRRRAAEEELLYEMDRNRGFQDLILELRDIIARQQQQV